MFEIKVTNPKPFLDKLNITRLKELLVRNFNGTSAKGLVYIEPKGAVIKSEAAGTAFTAKERNKDTHVPTPPQTSSVERSRDWGTL